MAEPDFFSKQTRDSRRFYLNLNPPTNDPLTVVCGGVERVHSDYLIERPEFPYFAIELVAEGRGFLALGSQKHQLSQGSVFAYGPGIPHRIENFPPGEMKKYFLDLAGSEAEQLIRDAGLLDGVAIQTERVIELTDLWDLIDHEARDSSLLSHKICELLSRTLLLKLRQRKLSSEQRASPSYAKYEKVRSFIEENYLEFKTIEEVAAACGLTSAYVSRLFKRHNALGAYRMLMRLRMRYAADLLIHNKMRVSEVAAELGFSDQFQFTRAFKREHGVAPTSFARWR